MIAILNIRKRNQNFHARYSAKLRVYEYVIYNRVAPSVINQDRGWHIMKKLDLKEMKRGAKKLIGTKDFSTFRASSCNAKSPIRTIKSVKIKNQNDKNRLRTRAKCAANWLEKYAPEEFKFKVQDKCQVTLVKKEKEISQI